jgi:hypothetical protein
MACALYHAVPDFVNYRAVVACPSVAGKQRFRLEYYCTYSSPRRLAQMKCPQCGYWNRSSFPKCYKCGTELPFDNQVNLALDNQNQTAPAANEATIIYKVDDLGNLSAETDNKDILAAEMSNLHIRKQKGVLQQRQMREDGARRGFAPSSSVKSYTRRKVNIPASESAEGENDEGIEGNVRPDAIQILSAGEEPVIDYDDYHADSSLRSYGEMSAREQKTMTVRQMKQTRRFGARRFFPQAAILLVAVILGFCAYWFLIRPMAERREPPLQDRVIITASILNDMAAHTIQIPAHDGSQIYIKELKKSYIAMGGYATIEAADYIWYDQNESVTAATMEITLTPYIKTSAGEQKPLDTIHYPIDIPLSPIDLINPDVTYVQVSTAIYNIKFHVVQNSTVTINGEDFSTFVNTQDGYITYNASVQPVGDNNITIKVRSQYYQENTLQITLYRAPQEIPLDLASTLGDSSSSKTLSISATTLPGAQITILSDYMNLDKTKLAASGAFSFDAVFNSIGTNTIIIQAEYQNKAPTVVKYDIYYLPPASEYTRKAWAMDDYNYTELLNNISRRVATTQIYVCIGEIVEILSTKPQLAIMDTDSSDRVRKVLLENLSSDTWVIGKSYRVYADAYGLYDAMPRLVGRYTYKPY